jgi:5-methylcytosine-specific restriction endonuclease McrA
VFPNPSSPWRPACGPVVGALAHLGYIICLINMAESRRTRIRRRAQNICEYCRSPQRASILPHQIDHTIAQQLMGLDAASNLCLCCLRCNLKKGPNIASTMGKIISWLYEITHPIPLPAAGCRPASASTIPPGEWRDSAAWQTSPKFPGSVPFSMTAEECRPHQKPPPHSAPTCLVPSSMVLRCTLATKTSSGRLCYAPSSTSTFIENGTDPGSHGHVCAYAYSAVVHGLSRCGICCKPYRAGDKRSLDHIIPLGAGGSDSAFTVQSAHLRCNLRKHVRWVLGQRTSGVVSRASTAVSQGIEGRGAE